MSQGGSHITRVLSRRKHRRWRRKLRRGRMLPAEATGISTRTRWRLWPITKAVTRYHHRPEEVQW